VTTQTVTAAPGRRSRYIFDIAFEMQRKGLLQFFADAWKTYGDFCHIQIGPRSLFLVIHPDHVHYVNVANRQNYEKLQSYDVVRELLLGDGLLTSTGETWRIRRKLMAPFFTPRGVEQYYPLILADGLEFIERWQGKAGSGQPVEMIDEMMVITASIILKTLFSTQTGEDLLEMKDAVETMIRFTSSQEMMPLKLPLWAPTPRNVAYRQARQRVNSFIDSVIAQRRAIPEAQWPEDLLSKLMRARSEETGEALSDELLRDESITMFFAGHETTARTLSFMWYALSQHPDVEKRLHQEIDAVLGDRPPEIADLKKLVYTLQVIKETLRLYPAAPVYVRDAVADDTIDGMYVPAGAQMMMVPYLTHRHPDFWEDPERFDPDRWTPAEEARRHPLAYHPFAAGQRICIGNNFSLFESHMLAAMLARRFTPRLVAGHQPEIVMAGTLGSANGMPMYIEQR
jgi:cytochrome P450